MMQWMPWVAKEQTGLLINQWTWTNASFSSYNLQNCVTNSTAAIILLCNYKNGEAFYTVILSLLFRYTQLPAHEFNVTIFVQPAMVSGEIWFKLIHGWLLLEKMECAETGMSVTTTLAKQSWGLPGLNSIYFMYHKTVWYKYLFLLPFDPCLQSLGDDE